MFAVTPRNGSVFTPTSKLRTSSGLTVAAESTGWFDASVGKPLRLRPTDLKPVAYVAYALTLLATL